MRRKRKTHRLQMAQRMGHPKSQERKESSQEQPLPPFADGAQDGAPEKSRTKGIQSRATPPTLCKRRKEWGTRKIKGKMPSPPTRNVKDERQRQQQIPKEKSRQDAGGTYGANQDERRRQRACPPSPKRRATAGRR